LREKGKKEKKPPQLVPPVTLLGSTKKRVLRPKKSLTRSNNPTSKGRSQTNKHFVKRKLKTNAGPEPMGKEKQLPEKNAITPTKQKRTTQPEKKRRKRDRTKQLSERGYRKGLQALRKNREEHSGNHSSRQVEWQKRKGSSHDIKKNDLQ